MSETVFSGFLPRPSIPLSDDHGSWQRRQLPTGGSSIPHPPGVLPATTSAWQGVPLLGAGMGKEVQLSLLCGPGVNRWDMDEPFP